MKARPLVLIVDDVPSNIEVLAEALSVDYDISFATSGAEGVDIATRYPPDLILLDVVMPGMNGFDACRQIRANEVLHDMPIIFISTMDALEDKIGAFRAGGSDYVTKPFEPEEVMARVSTHVSLYLARRELRDREETLRRNLSELETAHRSLLELGSQLAEAEKQSAIGQLAAGVAHEINNPLGFIYSNLGTLSGYVDSIMGLVDAYTDAESLLPLATGVILTARRDAIDLEFVREDIHALIAESRAGAERVRAIVQNLLQFSRSLDDPIEIVDLNALVDEALSAVWREPKPKAELTRQYAQLPPVGCMHAQIVRALTDLLTNALLSMPDGGRLDVRTEHVGDEVRVSIRDTGRGIPPEIRGRIFDPFFVTHPQGKGCCMGLSVAHGIVARHDGHIDLASEMGKGSVFTVRLPARVGGKQTQA